MSLSGADPLVCAGRCPLPYGLGSVSSFAFPNRAATVRERAALVRAAMKADQGSAAAEGVNGNRRACPRTR
jgi:hypothetical protein